MATGIEWGVNGHPLYYPGMTTQQQLSLVSQLGMTSYRVDVYDTSASTMTMLSNLVTQGKAVGVSILPIMILNPSNYSSESTAYSAGKAMATTFAKALPGMTWELGNEYDNFAIKSGMSGRYSTDYDSARYGIVRGLLSGMSDGIHQADANAKGIIDNAGWYHFGFQQKLAADGVNWDISGEHFYSDQGMMTNVGGSGTNALAELAKLGKPIMVTEFNNRDGSMASEQAETDYLLKTMNELNAVASTYNVKSAYIYELLDEPGLSGGEAHYGLASSTGTVKSTGNAIHDFIASHPSVPQLGTADSGTTTGGTTGGTTSPTTITGTSGNDTLSGVGGDLKLIGGTGNDTYIVNSQGDLVIEKSGEGVDTVQSSISYTLPEYVENLVLTGTGAINGTGSFWHNQMTGNNSANTLSGKAGNDTMAGQGGNDILIGGQGMDRLTGGSGADKFKYVSLSDGSFVSTNVTKGTVMGDTITDFTPGTDKLVIDHTAFALAQGRPHEGYDLIHLNTAFNGTNASGKEFNSGDATLIIDSTNTLYYDANGKSAGYTVLATLSNGVGANVHASDIVIA